MLAAQTTLPGPGQAEARTTRLRPALTSPGRAPAKRVSRALSRAGRRLRAVPSRIRQRVRAHQHLVEQRRVLARQGVDPEIARFALRFYGAVGRASLLETAISSPEFRASATDPDVEHPSSFATHGVDHAVDVVRHVRPVMRELDRSGLLVRRTPERRAFVEALALQIAALHDIGNGADGFSRAARAEHRQFAAQAVMSRGFDPAARSVLRGPVGRYLLARSDRLAGHSAQQVVREMLAGGTLHDKVTAEELLSPERLAARMRADLSRPLEVAPALGAPSRARTASYGWLGDRELFEDFRDAAALVVTGADALRMRGRRLRDSSDASFGVTRQRGIVLHFKHTLDGRVLPSRMRSDSPFPIGDAAIHFARLERGRLAVGLTSGRYGKRGEHNERIADGVAFQIEQIMADTLDRVAAVRGSHEGLGIVLYRAPDEGASGFAELVRDRLPARLRSRVEIRGPRPASSGQVARAARVRQRQEGLYRAATPLAESERSRVWRAMADGGLPVDKVRGASSKAASARVLGRARRLQVPAGTRVIERGAPVDYVFVVESGGAELVDETGNRLRVGRGVVLGQEAAVIGSPLGSPVEAVVRGRGRIGLVAIPVSDYAAGFGDAYHLPGDLIDLSSPD